MSDRQHMLLSAYKEQFGLSSRQALHYVGAPGRVNVIGEHTDYNQGFVLPMAIEQAVHIVAGRRDDERIHVYSLNFEELAVIDLAELQNISKRPSWLPYVQGILLMLQQAGYDVRGMNMVMHGNVPLGAGLSSSAALSMATLLAASATGAFNVEPTEAARLAQHSENDIVGVQCGIMDQFASRLGRQNAAVLLDCRSLAYELIPIQNEDVRIVITNSNVQRGLVDSEYNIRREQCEEGAQLLGVPSLRDVSLAMFEQNKHRLPSVIQKRCQHVIGENERVLSGAHYLKQGDIVRLGNNMNDSHISLRDLYEVSCPELDVLVDIAQDVPGVYGSRMTGAGFGGCTVTLVQHEALSALQEAIDAVYTKKTGLSAHTYVVTIQDGGAFQREIS